MIPAAPTRPRIRERKRCVVTSLGVTGGLVGSLLLSVAVFAQDKPTLTIDADCPAFAMAPDNRIAYAVRRIVKTKRYDLERDDIWVASPEGRKKRIVDGEKLVKSPVPFSYAIKELAWSPDGRQLTVQMDTLQVVDARGTTQEGELVDLMNDEGKEINIEGTRNSVIPGAYQAAWLADGVTVAFLTEAVKPKLLFSIGTVRPAGGRGGIIFPRRTFSAVAWDARRNAAVAVERSRDLSGPIRLVSLDLLQETRTELAVLSGYLGQLSLSPSGNRVAYFRDGDTLEVRNLARPERALEVKAAYGHFEWSRDENRILLKRGPEKKSGDLVWVSIPGGALEPVLHDLLFRDFAISLDGRWLAVTQPGGRGLQLYPFP